MNEEVINKLALVNRVRVLESELNNLKIQQGEVNKTLNLHKGELINHATNTFVAQQNEVDKELILTGLPFNNSDDWHQCKARIKDRLHKNGIRSHFSLYAINASKRSCRLTFL